MKIAISYPASTFSATGAVLLAQMVTPDSAVITKNRFGKTGPVTIEELLIEMAVALRKVQ